MPHTRLAKKTSLKRAKFQLMRKPKKELKKEKKIKKKEMFANLPIEFALHSRLISVSLSHFQPIFVRLFCAYFFICVHSRLFTFKLSYRIHTLSHVHIRNDLHSSRFAHSHQLTGIISYPLKFLHLSSNLTLFIFEADLVSVSENKAALLKVC